MPIQKQANGSISITAMSLVEFLPLVVDAIKEGYELDLESNEGYPQQLGTLLVLTMFPKSVQDSPLSTESQQALVVDKVVPEVTTTASVQRGRPRVK